MAVAWKGAVPLGVRGFPPESSPFPAHERYLPSYPPATSLVLNEIDHHLTSSTAPSVGLH